MRIHFCGGSYERFLNLCANHKILLWDVCPVEKGYEANLFYKDFFKLGPLARKCRTRIRICRKYGFPFFLNRHRKRKVFALGLCFCGFFIFYLSCFVWNITLDGNVSISRQTMMEYLTSQKIGYGTRKSTVDCKQLAADLRNDFPNITWVSVRLQGTYLSIQVQENTDRIESVTAQEEKMTGASDLVAEEDGTVVSIITREGIPIVHEGDTVKKGDVLVTGEMPITDDSENVVSYRYCTSDADVYIQTDLTYEDEFSLAHETVFYTGRKRYAAYLKMFGRYFGVNLGLNYFDESDIVGQEKQMCLMKDFYFPFSVGVLQAREYHTVVETYTKEEAIQIADAKLKKFLSQNEEKGVQIFQNNVKINVSATSCHAEGTLSIVKKTGRNVRTQKSDFPQEGTDE